MTFTKVTNTGIGSTGTVLLQNLDVIGIVTAGFGVSTVDVFTTGVSTFSGVTNITNTTDSTSSTTGALIVTGGVGIAASLNVGGSVSVGGTLTYEDVTNVDSVGIITARSNILVGSGITLSPDGDVFTTGVSTFSSNVNIGVGTTGSVTITPDAAVKATFTGVSGQDIIQISTGNVTGDTFANIKGVNKSGIRIRGGGSYGGGMIELAGGLRSTEAGVIKVHTGTEVTDNNSEKVRIASDGKIGIGTAGPTALLHLAAGGGGNVIELQRNSTNTTGNIGAINFTAFDGHSVGSIGAYGDGDNEGAYINFKTTSAASANSPFTSTTERLRIGSAGQIGIAGANYGSDNQALTSQGSSSAVEWRGINGPVWDSYQTTAHNVADVTWTLVTNLTATAPTTSGVFSSSTFTVPAGGAGTYFIYGYATIDDIQADDFVISGIVINHSTNGAEPSNARRGGFGCSGGANERVTSHVAVMHNLSVGDTVRLSVYHNEGTTEATEPYYTRFGGYRLSV